MADEVRAWPEIAPGVVRFPTGARIRGRSYATAPVYNPDYAVVIAGRQPADPPWPSTWIKWTDFGLPTDPSHLAEVLWHALLRAEVERVEVTCRGGIGRTGAALACIAVVDGVPAKDAVDFVRERYHPLAAETPWQRRFVRRFVAYSDLQ